MNKDSDCYTFRDLIDALFEGDAPAVASSQLQAHAQTCPDCAMLLKMQGHLKGVSLQELEATVPGGMVEGMWPRVERDILREEWRKSGRRAVNEKRAGRWRWVIAAQAAAIVLLAAGAAFLSGQLRQAQLRESLLAQRLAVQENQVAAVGRSIPLVPAVGAGVWQTRTPDADYVTVAEATSYLQRLPGDALVLDAASAKKLMKQIPYAFSGVAPEVLAGIRAGDGLQAREALSLIAALDLHPSQQFPASRITGLSKRFD